MQLESILVSAIVIFVQCAVWNTNAIYKSPYLSLIIIKSWSKKVAHGQQSKGNENWMWRDWKRNSEKRINN